MQAKRTAFVITGALIASLVGAVQTTEARPVASAAFLGSCVSFSPNTTCTFLGIQGAFHEWDISNLGPDDTLDISVDPGLGPSSVYSGTIEMDGGSHQDCTSKCSGASSDCCSVDTPPGGTTICADNADLSVCIAFDRDGVIVDGGSCNCAGVS